jgi:WD40 repeat protein
MKSGWHNRIFRSKHSLFGRLLAVRFSGKCKYLKYAGSGLVLLLFFSCSKHSENDMSYKEIQLTDSPSGHTINSIQCFSPDGKWIVYDTRNDDTQIISTGEIAMVNTESGEKKSLYRTTNQTAYGPGVGAATFSPVEERVLFIHGIRNADQSRPYAMSRRTGVAVDVKNPFQPIFLDARDVEPPFTPGALRGGTHAHTWSGDGQWITCTYNDYVLEGAEKNNPGLKDLRTIAVLAPGYPVTVKGGDSLENNSGEMYAFPVALVTEKPVAGSDQIEKAFDECWIGTQGYKKPDGSIQHRAIAFQGHVRTAEGALKTEVFVADIPEDLVDRLSAKSTLTSGMGGKVQRLPVPSGVSQRRITFLEKGISGPRHWLRTKPDGSMIGFLSEDEGGFIQVFGVSPTGGELVKLTRQLYNVQGPFSFSPDGTKIAYIADNSIFIADTKTGEFERATPRTPDETRPMSGVVWSPDGSTLCYNRFVKKNDSYFLQIFLLKR